MKNPNSSEADFHCDFDPSKVLFPPTFIVLCQGFMMRSRTSPEVQEQQAIAMLNSIIVATEVELNAQS